MIIEIRYCRCAVTGEIETSDIYPSESVSTGEIKVDDAAAVDVGGPSVTTTTTDSNNFNTTSRKIRVDERKKNGLTFKNPKTRNNQSSI